MPPSGVPAQEDGLHAFLAADLRREPLSTMRPISSR